MTHIERMIWWFQMHRGKATLGEILQSGEPWSYEFRARMTDAKKRGIHFRCQRNKPPSANLYSLVAFDASGQGALL